jgi:glycosyltransferase involved in cell wall biosynthesis
MHAWLRESLLSELQKPRWQQMTSSRTSGGVIFVGIAKNVRPYISKVLANVDKYASDFVASKVMIVENDSTDGTQDILLEWASSDGRHIYMRANDNPCDGLTRTERLAYFRNIYLGELQKEIYDSFEYVVVFDCDNIINSWIDKEAFNSAVRFLAKEKQNAAIFANTMGFYYDVWTLRHPIWCPGDCWDDVKRLSAVMSYKEAVRSCVGARQVRIEPGAPPIAVTSAFGGLAIYKRRYLIGKRYFAQNQDGSPACEHVSVNESISADGGKLYIFPQLLVKTPYEHIHRARDRCYYRTLIGEYLEGWCRRLEVLICPEKFPVRNNRYS